LGGLHFKEEGYFVTRWNSAGGADFFAYKIPDYLKVLKKHGVVKDGAFLAELELFPLVRFRDEKTSIYTDGKYDIAVCEAEARVNLAIRSSTGIGQKIGWADEHHSVYGVGPTNYKPEPKHIHEFFGENAGAIVFTTDTYDKVVIKPLKSEFTTEIGEITAMKHLIKSIFVNRLLINKKFERFTDIVHYIEVTPLEHVLEDFLNST